MKRNLETKCLLYVLLIISVGFLLLHSSYTDRNLPSSLVTRNGELDISHYFLEPFPNALYAAFFVALFFLMHVYLRVKLPEADPLILPALAMLCGVGQIMILRLSPDIAAARNEAIMSIVGRNPSAYVKDNVLGLAQLGMKHFIFIVVGIFVMVLSITVMNRRTFAWLSSKKYVWVFLSAMLIVITLVFGSRINGKSLWLFGIQTVELVKLLLLLFMAGYIYEKGKGIVVYRDGTPKSWFTYAGPFVAMWFFALAPILIQGDLGPTFLIFVTFLLMFYYAGNRHSATLVFVVFIAACGYISYKIGYPPIVRERFDMVLDPFGRSESMSRVLWSISSGGIHGSGIGYGQPHRIPEVQSDFTFAAICEEMGFVGGAAIILAYAVLVRRCFKIASCVENAYKKTLAAGIGTLIGAQAFIIISGNLNCIPMTGITLPLVSYGGSSMVVTFLMAGIVMRISGERA